MWSAVVDQQGQCRVFRHTTYALHQTSKCPKGYPEEPDKVINGVGPSAGVGVGVGVIVSYEQCGYERKVPLEGPNTVDPTALISYHLIMAKREMG